MRVIRWGQPGLLVAVVAAVAGSGIGCGESGSTPTASTTSSTTSELVPRRKPSPFESKVKQQNTVADQNGFALKTDPDLQNAWGLVFKGDSAWVAANHTGTVREYSDDGTFGDVISLPLASGDPSSPTGQVINRFPHAFMGDAIVTVSEDGVIFGVNPGTPTAAIRVTTDTAVYKGDAIAMFHGKPRLFATDFFNRKVDAFEADYSPAKLGGDFVDPELATLTEDGTTPKEMYAPFNIMPFRDKLLVTFALQAGPDNEDDDPGPGRGFVDIFDTDGNYVQRLITRGNLNSPWGMALSREHVGDVDLIVGNFGDGHVNVYGLSTSMHGRRVRANFEGPIGYLRGGPVVIEGLWAIAFGNGGDFEADELYFTAGPGNGEEIETHGLFGELDFVGPRR